MANLVNSRPEPRWPPRSPHEALLCSPTGRKKLRQYQDRTSPSPSPLKSSSARIQLGQLSRVSVNQTSVGQDEDEDEETLQLQLAALEAKIKLKKLQQRKNKGTAAGGGQGSGDGGSVRASGKENSKPMSQKLDNGVPSLKQPKDSTSLQIPVSPQRKRIDTGEAHSPGRILLGIDKGLKGKNVTLRRPAGEATKNDDPFRIPLPHDNVSRSFGLSRSSSVSQSDHSSKQKSFSEKIAETRQQDKARKEKADKLRRQKTAGFGVEQREFDDFQSAAESKHHNTEPSYRTANQAPAGEFSRDEILKATQKANKGQVHRSNSNAGVRRSRATPSTDIWINPNAPLEASEPPKTIANAAKKRSRSLSPPSKTADQSSQSNDPGASDSLFEPFSSLHLSKRLLPRDFLTRTLTDKHIFRLPDLLGTVKSPDYILPDIPETDYVVFAIIASKSSPLNHKGGHKSTSSESTSTSEAVESEQNANGKYMVLTLTDLKWTVDLFLFSTGYTRFRKLTPGTIVALLNPDIMPPPPGKADTGRFSLKLSSSDDTVLEIGTSRDLGWCKSVRKDGKQCDSWIDKRHTEFCEFHVDVVIERTRRGRMEVQGMSAPFAPGGRNGGRTGYFGDKRRGQKPSKEDGFNREGRQYDRGSGSQYFVAPSLPGQSAAQLLDAEGATDRYGSKEDRLRKRLAEREKEYEIARKLGEGGNGAGSEYLRLKQQLGPATGAAEPQAAELVDANSLGLLGNKAKNVHLSPIKRKRIGSGVDMQGSRKKTRFVTDTGIKEAGRESLGGDGVTGSLNMQDDDDGLEVV